MTPRKLAALRLDTDVIEGLERVKERSGAPRAEQVRRSIQGWPNATPPRTVSTTRQLLVQRTGIRFHNLDREHVAIEIEVENRGPATSEPASLRLEAAPLGAFVRWRPLATLAVPAIPPRRTQVLRIVVQQPRPQPPGSFSGLVPPALRTASGRERQRAVVGELGGVVGELAHSLAMLRAPVAISAHSTTLPPDPLDLLGGARPHWAGNLNVWIGDEPVERHLAPRLRIHAGRANLALFCVGDRPDRYAFRVECAAEWGLALSDAASGASIECSREPGDEPRWLAVPGRSLVLAGPPTAARLRARRGARARHPALVREDGRGRVRPRSRGGGSGLLHALIVGVGPTGTTSKRQRATEAPTPRHGEARTSHRAP